MSVSTLTRTDLTRALGGLHSDTHDPRDASCRALTVATHRCRVLTHHAVNARYRYLRLQADAPIAMAAWLYRQGTVEQILAAIEGRIAAAEPNDQFEDRRLTLPR